MITKTLKITLCAGALIFTSQLAIAQTTQKVSESTLERLVTTKISMDKEGAFDDRYTIHIFQGENQQANSVKARYDALGMVWKSELRYDSPNHKVCNLMTIYNFNFSFFKVSKCVFFFF